MRATFIGVPGEQHSSLNMYGQTFPLNEAVEIDNPQARSKLARHPHFKVERSAEDDDPRQERQIESDFKAAGNASLAELEAQRLQDEQDAAARSRGANAQTARYSDGASATGPGALPGQSPAQQAAQEQQAARTKEQQDGGDPERTGNPAAAQAAGSRQGGGRRGG